MKARRYGHSLSKFIGFSIFLRVTTTLIVELHQVTRITIVVIIIIIIITIIIIVIVIVILLIIMIIIIA